MKDYTLIGYPHKYPFRKRCGWCGVPMTATHAPGCPALDDPRDGCACLLRQMMAPLLDHLIAAQGVTGLDSTECRYDLHGECQDDQAVHCLCACHKRPEIWGYR